MNKLRIVGFIFVIISTMTTVNAQTYDHLWKQVKEFSEKDLPKSASEAAVKIYGKAQKEKNAPQMMKAYLTWMTFREKISPDSLSVDMGYLEEWAAEEKSEVNKAVLYSILAEKVKSNELRKFVAYIDKSLEKVDVLFATSGKKMQPLVSNGATSQTYFNDNLYDLLARRAIKLCKDKRMMISDVALPRLPEGVNTIEEFMKVELVPEKDTDLKTKSWQIYQSLLRIYEEKGNRSAWLLTALDAAEALDDYVNGFSNEDVEAQLRLWLSTYADLEVCAEVYLKLMEYRYTRNNYMEQLSLLGEAIKKYPDYDRINALKNVEKKILAPDLNVTLKHETVYPGQEMSLEVAHRNLSGFTLQIYKLPYTADAAELDSVKEQTIDKYGNLFREEHFDLPQTADHKFVRSVLKTMTPEVGIYYYRLIPDEESEPKGEIVHVSRLYILRKKVGESSYHFVVVDKESGCPIEDAEIVTYMKKNGKLQPMRTYTARKYGIIPLNERGKRLIYHARRQGDETMKIENIWIGEYMGKKDTLCKEYVDIYTDRPIYRPGQTVRFSGVVYRQKRDSIGVAEGVELSIELKYQSKELMRKTVLSDDYGTFSEEFVLPSDALTGVYRIGYGGMNWTFRVEEYKRPTFDVKFNPVKENYQMGDSIKVEGLACTFAGAPIQNASVGYTLQKKYNLWWKGDEMGSELNTGTTITNEKGEFQIPIYFEKENTPYWYWIYSLEVAVTSASGETQKQLLQLPIGSSSLALNVSNKWQWKSILKRKRIPLCFDVVNLKNEKVDIPVVYRVYQWVDGQDDYSKDMCMFEDTITSNTLFIPVRLYNTLPSGKYVMEAMGKDERGRICKGNATFTLFDLTDKKIPVKATEWSYQSSDVFEGKKPIIIAFGSSEKDVYVYCTLSYNNKIKTAVRKLSDSLIAIKIPYKEEYGEGASFTYGFVKKGKLYDNHFRMMKPLPDKELKLKWTTFRDHLYPGQQETWTLKAQYKNGVAAKANLMATLYDASLEHLYSYNWKMNVKFERFVPGGVWREGGEKYYRWPFSFPMNLLSYPDWQYSKLELPQWEWRNGKVIYVRGSGNTTEVFENDVSFKASELINVPAEVKYVPVEVDEIASPQIRTNFNETAFFYPNLRTDANGEVSISFTLPESLTTWKFMGLAHTKDMDYGQITSEVVASKEFMIQPNLPRFVRVGDEVSLSASLINLSDKDVIGNVRMELFHPATDKVYLVKKQRFLVTPKGTATVNFGFEVSEEYTDLAVRWVAEGDTFSDGEQRVLPVLSNKQQMTESVPVYIDGEGTSTFSLESLFNHHSKSVSRPKMTVEFTGNPGWYAVQALQSLKNPDNEDALSWSVAYYANALDKYLAEAHPQVARRFDVDTLGFRISKAFRQLKELQDEEGAWSWYKGMSGNRYITTQIVEQLTRLQMLTGNLLDSREAMIMYDKALDYLSAKAKEEYTSMRKLEKKGVKNLCPSEQVLHYLYISALNGNRRVDKIVNEYFIGKLMTLENTGLLTIYGKANGAIILQQAGKTEKAKELLQSLMEYSVYTDEMGRYFDTPKAEYSWYSYKIPTQVAAIEAVHRIVNEEKTVEEMKRWLLQQKRVQDWDTPIATTDAVYALLNVGENVLANTGECQIVLGKDKIRVTKNDTLAYINQEVKGDVMNIREVTVKKTSQGIGWGAVYAEYWEDMDRIGVQGNALSIRKEVYKGGKPLAGTEPLRVGDKLTVRLTVKADRDMDFIEVKDERAACMEPVDVLSGYCWRDGIGYYQRTKDSSTSFFMDRLRKGTYTLEYDVYVNLAGSYQGGAATVRSVYAPEFGGHVGGKKMTVE